MSLKQRLTDISQPLLHSITLSDCCVSFHNILLLWHFSQPRPSTQIISQTRLSIVFSESIWWQFGDDVSIFLSLDKSTKDVTKNRRFSETSTRRGFLPKHWRGVLSVRADIFRPPSDARVGNLVFLWHKKNGVTPGPKRTFLLSPSNQDVSIVTHRRGPSRSILRLSAGACLITQHVYYSTGTAPWVGALLCRYITFLQSP